MGGAGWPEWRDEGLWVEVGGCWVGGRKGWMVRGG